MARRSVNKRRGRRTVASALHFCILIQGVLVSDWHFNFRCFYISVLWMGIVSLHVYAPVGDHDSSTIAIVTRQKRSTYCRLMHNVWNQRWEFWQHRRAAGKTYSSALVYRTDADRRQQPVSGCTSCCKLLRVKFRRVDQNEWKWERSARGDYKPDNCTLQTSKKI